MDLILIAAVAENNVIGKDGGIPWRLPEDMRRFKELTTGYPVIMGRKTYESLPDRFRPLPNRWNIVLTRQPEYIHLGIRPEGISLAPTLEDALHFVERHLPRQPEAEGINRDRAYVIGGQSVYEAALPLANRLEITHVYQTVDGDAFFPEIDPQIWLPTNQIGREGYAFVTYRRR